jgi:hypothetical protein
VCAELTWRSRCGSLVLVALLAACSASVGATDSEPSATSSAAAVADRACNPIDLRTPSGQRIDLTGTWKGYETLHFVRQYGDCVWWEELTALQDEPLGNIYRSVFFGRLQTDFTLVGQWADIYTGILPNGAPVIPSNGEAVWEIIIESEGTAEVTTLRGLWRFPDADGIRPTIVLTRVDAGTALPAR